MDVVGAIWRIHPRTNGNISSAERKDYVYSTTAFNSTVTLRRRRRADEHPLRTQRHEPDNSGIRVAL